MKQLLELIITKSSRTGNLTSNTQSIRVHANTYDRHTSAIRAVVSNTSDIFSYS